MSIAAAPDRAPERFPFLTVAAFLLLMTLAFTLTLSKNHNDAEDAVTFIHQVNQAEPSGIFHPNHLIYNYINLGFYSLWQDFGYSDNARLPMQLLNVIASLITLAMTAFFGWRLGLSREKIVLALVLLVSCYGYWWYSVEVESYLLPLPFALIAWYNCLVFMTRGSIFHLMVAAVAIAIAMLIHLQWLALPISLGVALLFNWWRLRHEIAHLKMLFSLLLAVSVILVIVVTVYLAAIFSAYPVTTLAGAVDWVNGSHHLIYRPPWSVLSPVKTLVGFFRSIWGGHFLFGFTELETFFRTVFPDKLLLEEFFLGQSMSLAGRWFSVATSVFAVVAGLFVSIKIFWSRPKATTSRDAFYQQFVVSAVLTVAVFFALNSVIVPTNLELYIGILPILSLLLVSYLASFQAEHPAFKSLWIFTIFLFLSNLIGSILPQTDPQRDYWQAANQYLIEHGGKTDIIISEGGYVNDSYIQLFSQAQFRQGRLMTVEQIDQMLASDEYARVLVSSWVIDPPPAIRVQLPEYDLEGAKKLFAQYQLKPLNQNSYSTIYQIKSSLLN